MNSNIDSKEDYGPQTIPWNLQECVNPKSTDFSVDKPQENKHPEPNQKNPNQNDSPSKLKSEHSSSSISIDSILEKMDNKDPELAKRIAIALSKSNKMTDIPTTKTDVTVTTDNGSKSQNTIKQSSDDVRLGHLPQPKEAKETDILCGNVPNSSEGMTIPKFDSHLISENVDNFGFTYHKLARDPNRNQPGRNMDHPGSTTLAITMIVKNETKVIKRLLDSIFPFLDYWVISDTGSTDGTPEMIINYFKEKNIPGELHYVPWKNSWF